MSHPENKQQGKYEARRIRRDGRIVILPPEGYGNVWIGADR